MRFGIRAARNKLGNGTRNEQEAANLLRGLDEGNAPIGEYLALLEELRQSSILPESVWLCLATDLVEETAEKIAVEEIGTEDEFDEHHGELEEDLSDRLKELIREFLDQTSMPLNCVFRAIERVMDDIKEGCLDQENLVEPYYDQLRARVAQLMPQPLRDAGCQRLATLYEDDPTVFQTMKQDGERWLIGMTYEEERQQSLRNLFSDS